MNDSSSLIYDRPKRVHVYCGCSISTGFFDDRECGWEGAVAVSEEAEDRATDTFDCPQCGATSLPVTDHETGWGPV